MYECASFFLGLEARGAISPELTPNQGGIAISIWLSLSENNLDLYVAVPLAIHSHSIRVKGVL